MLSLVLGHRATGPCHLESGIAFHSPSASPLPLLFHISPLPYTGHLARDSDSNYCSVAEAASYGLYCSLIDVAFRQASTLGGLLVETMNKIHTYSMKTYHNKITITLYNPNNPSVFNFYKMNPMKAAAVEVVALLYSTKDGQVYKIGTEKGTNFASERADFVMQFMSAISGLSCTLFTGLLYLSNNGEWVLSVLF